MKDFDRVKAERISAQKELSEIQRAVDAVEGGLAKCTAEKHKLSTELSHCTKSLSEVPSNNHHVSIVSMNGDSTSSHGFSGISSSSNSNGPITTSDGSNRWLVIGIPTVPRAHNEDYLLRSLSAMADQLPADPNDLLYGQVLIVLLNVNGPGHERFDEAKALYAPDSPNNKHPKGVYFEFHDIARSGAPRGTSDSEDVWVDPKSGADPHNDPGTPNRPGYRVRKQTRNIVAVMRKSLGKGKYYLFLEDDMQICGHGFLAIQVRGRKIE
jgi:hypothetical protein